MELPEEICEWCGQPYKYVRVVQPPKWHTEGVPVVKIDAAPLAPHDWRGTLARVPPAVVGGRIDCATPVADAMRSKLRYVYSKHRDTCEQADKWGGHKKWHAPKRREEIDSPELDIALARKG